MEKTKILKISNGQPFLCIDEKYLAEIYKKAGRPGLRVVPEQIHFIPFKVKWDNPSAFLWWLYWVNLLINLALNYYIILIIVSINISKTKDVLFKLS